MNKTIMTLALTGLMFATSGQALAGDHKRGDDRRDRIERHADRHYDRGHRHHYRDRRHSERRHYRKKAARHYGYRPKRHFARHYHYRPHRHGVHRYRHARGHHCRIRDRHYHNGYAYYGSLERIIAGAVALGVINEILDH